MYQHNSKIYKYLSAVAFPFFWQPILFLFFTIHNGLSATQSLSMTALYSLAVVLLEVPSGAVSDHFSRKFSAALGYLLKGIAIFSLTLTPNLYLLSALMVLLALGESLTSGSIESLIYDSVKNDGEVTKKHFKKLFSSSRVIIHFSLAVYIAVGGYIGSRSLTLPLQLSLPFYLFAAYLCTQFIENKSTNSSKKYQEHILQAFHTIFSQKGQSSGLLTLMLADFLIAGLISAAFWITTPLLSSFSYSVFTIGILTSGFRIVKSISSYFIAKLDDENDLRPMMFSAVVIAISFALTGLVHTGLVLIGMLVVFYGIQGYYQANNLQLLNDKIGSDNRTTINSIQNLFVRLYEFTMLPVIGYFIDQKAIPSALFLISLLVTIALIFLYQNRHRISPQFYP